MKTFFLALSLGLVLVGVVLTQSQCYYDTVQKRMICCDRYGMCI